MAGLNFTSPSVTAGHKGFSGGLNSASGPLNLQDNESSDLLNVDFNKFGSVLSRNGYSALNTSAITNDPNIDGLHWFEYNSSGTQTRKAINVSDGKFWKMDDLDGTWDDITGGLTITADNHCDFENWRNKVFVTNNVDVPFEWDGSTAQTIQNVPVTDAKFVKQFNNYLFLANVIRSGTRHNSRIYWSDLNDEGAWTTTSFIDISNDDGQEITGLRVLADRLIVFKTRSIYNVFFTGDTNVPFVLPGGGKTASSVGCVAPWSIQELENGLVFLSHDGFYYFDGNTSHKISDKINTTLVGYNTTRFDQAVSCVQKDKNRYFCALPNTSSTTNDRVLVWDYANNAWSVYDGMAPSSMATFYIDGDEERPYFGDYAGFVYRMDTGADDYPLNVQTAINSYYYTNWKSYEDLIDKKGIKQTTLYYQTGNTILSFAYSYDFEAGDTYTLSLNLSTSADTYGSGVYGTATYAGSGGSTKRMDLRGRGRVVRYKFANNVLSEQFQIDGLGALPHLETRV